MRFRAFTKKDLNRLQILQNQTLRLKLRASKYTSCKQLVKQSGELSVHQLIALHTLLQVHKVVCPEQKAGISIEQILFETSRKRPHISSPPRTNDTTKLSISRSSFVTRGARLWNRLPLQLRKCDKTDSFKYQAKKWVKNHISIKP